MQPEVMKPIRFLFVWLAFVCGTMGEDSKMNPATGMRIDKGWELVRAHCTGCHSAQQFTRQRGTRRNWEEMIRWMQKYHGLWPIDGKSESQILDCLSKHHGPQDKWRRAPAGQMAPRSHYPGSAATESISK